MKNRGILEGIRVVDWSHAQVGPYAASLLVELGADVIHVEDIQTGDQTRAYLTVFGVPLDLPGGRNLVFEQINQGKKGIALSLNKPEGKEIIYRLVEKADVFVTNFRKPESKGMDYATLRKYNARLIYARASAYGKRGTEKDNPSMEMAAWARAGAMLACSPAGCPPTYLTPAMGDRISGLCLAYGVLAALLARERYGIVQEVDVSQLGALMAVQGLALAAALWGRSEFERFDRSNNRNPLYNTYQCGDGKWIAVSAYQSQRYWGPFCRSLGLPQLEKDSRFADEPARAEHCKVLISLIDEAFARKTSGEWIAEFRKIDLLCDVINTVSDLLSDPQVLANNYIIDWDHPVLGKSRTLGHPVEFSESAIKAPGAAPEIGQHNEEVLLEYGYTWEDISSLKDKGVI